MVFKSIISTVSVCLAFVSFNTYALPSNIFDNDTYTTDVVTGLDWLDLSETNDMSYNYVSGQLGAGGAFEGWRYATSEQVVSFWGNFSVDLSALAVTWIPDTIDNGSRQASLLLGNLFNEYNPTEYSFGTLGITSHSPSKGKRDWLGAYHHVLGGDHTDIYYTLSSHLIDDNSSFIYTGSYLVRDATQSVPEPSIAILIVSGLMVFGVVRKKART